MNSKEHYNFNLVIFKKNAYATYYGVSIIYYTQLQTFRIFGRTTWLI